MKFRLTLLGCLLLVNQQANAAITLVSSVTGGSTTGTEITTGTMDSTGANFLVMVSSSFLSSQTQPTITDSKGNTWTFGTPGFAVGSGGSVIAWVASPSVGSGHTFTATCISGATCYPSLVIMAFSGVLATSPLDYESGSNGNSSHRTWSDGLGATSWSVSVAGEVCMSGMSSGTGTDPTPTSLTFTPNVVGGGSAASYTYLTQMNNGLNFGAALAYQFQSTVITEGLTLDSAGLIHGWNVACFKPGTGGPPPATFTALTLAP